MQVITTQTKVFNYAELTEAAKQSAREWYCQDLDNHFSESVIEYAKAIGTLMGWEIENIGYSGFWSQGDGAHFTGRMGYAKGCAKAVKSYAPTDAELHRIAAAWQALQRANFYALHATVRHSGHYQHENCTSFDCEDNRNRGRDIAEAEHAIEVIARDFMRWIYRQLEQAYEYETSDENVSDMCAANGYLFTESGKSFNY